MDEDTRGMMGALEEIGFFDFGGHVKPFLMGSDRGDPNS